MKKGFTLIELMIVVAICGILAAVAIPAINKYIQKERQKEEQQIQNDNPNEENEDGRFNDH